ncbi:MAG: glycosyltransferase family 2 protein [Desulfarculaceae bacterium]|nr:glycosyltransferase family 2 protein [Desulfarculaceae bacterium]MCF8072752.1 glycosyltransferase family 2 protein [Desulfarculaceae bacterium]MCF8100920.1 glycosyltransferase family 2 protein [Desulfarculaceae bacterium]MCF8118558.1 glycosyltransferase family 2 protein [Desulfarculaceae bacterium]
MSDKQPQITVAMISMNEEAAVGKVIADIQAAAPGAHVLLVDSSKDRTPEIARAAGAEVIRQFPPKGYGPAMMRALTSARGQVVVTLDCDDTYPTDRILPMAQEVLSGRADLVDASRLEKKPEAMPWVNYLANWGFAWLASILFLRRVTDLHSGMRAYRTSLFDEMTFLAQGSALPVELLLKPMARGKKVKAIFIPYDERTGESTLDPLKSAWWTLKRILRVRFGF